MLPDKQTASGGKTCPFCSDSGICAKCGGSGKRIFRKGWLGLKREVTCRACEGSGVCQLCRGTDAGMTAERH